eukprot:3438-Heterococcus_DN1.PRE.2
MSTSPLMAIETLHKEMVHDAQLDYYSRKLATASSDRTVEIFDISDKGSQRTAVLTGHEGPVWQATGSCDNKVRIWRCPVGATSSANQMSSWTTELKESDFSPHTDWGPNTRWTPALMNTFNAPVWRVSWSVTGNVLAVSYGDDSVQLWKQNIQGQWEHVSSVAGDDAATEQQQQH